jgi:hypothetical protein
MAGKGRPAELDSARTRRRGGVRSLGGGGHSAAPPPLGSGYSERTRAWYATWAKSEQASEFSPTDWQRLHMLAPLVELYFTSPSKDLMAEIRQNESKLGATAEDRLRLRWRIGGDAPDDRTEPAAGSRARRDPRLDLVGAPAVGKRPRRGAAVHDTQEAR